MKYRRKRGTFRQSMRSSMMNETIFLEVSNSYYNLGLKKARERHLTEAITNLNYALRLNKEHTDARNLLGLVYYEIGEMAEALVQWVISTNLRSENNAARRYLSLIRKKPGKLDKNEQILVKFNQALSYAKSHSEDLAILALNRIVESNPKFIKAQLLFALLNIQIKEKDKAKAAIDAVLQVDVNNLHALHLQTLLSDIRLTTKEKKEKELLAQSALGDEDVIIPATYKEYTGWQTVLNIGIGLLIGAATTFFLYMPTISARNNNLHNAELIKISKQLSDANNQIALLTKSNEEYVKQNEELGSSLSTSDGDRNYLLAQYQRILGVQSAIANNDMNRAVELFVSIDASVIHNMEESGADVEGILASIQDNISRNGITNLIAKGDILYSEGNFQTALLYFDTVLRLQPDMVEAMYKKAVTLKALADENGANLLYQQIVTEFPNSEYAERVKSERGF